MLQVVRIFEGFNKSLTAAGPIREPGTSDEKGASEPQQGATSSSLADASARKGRLPGLVNAPPSALLNLDG